MTEYDLSKVYTQYNEDILTHKIISCHNIYLAAERYKKWHSREDIYLDFTEVDKRIKLVSKMKHSNGKCAHQPFILLPYQQWIFANVFGWKYKSTNKRVTKNALIFCSRKQGKTCLAAAIAITELLMGQDGSEIDFIANSGAQARIGFNMTKNFCESLDPNKILFHRFRDSIRMPATKSFVDVLNSDSMTLDGRGASLFIVDEFGAAKNWDTYDVLKSSQGYIDEPLAIVITTANFLLDSYPCFEMRKTCIEILEGKKEDDTQFSAIYEVEEGDDWMEDESCWIKACPSLGQTVTYDFLRDQVRMAKNQPSTEVGVKTKLFNIFCQSSEIWLQQRYTSACFRDIKYDDFKNQMAYGGCDLASVSDLAAIATMYPPDESRAVCPDKYVFFCHCYAPESVLETSVNKQLYQHWAKQGYLTLTPGNVCDFDRIQEDLEAVNKDSPYVSIGIDPYNASQMQISCTNAGLPMEQYSQSLGSMNRPVKSIERLILMGNVVIAKNPLVLWCFNNCRPKFDLHENESIDKPTPEAKIDPVFAMLNCMGVYLQNSNVDVSVTGL